MTIQIVLCNASLELYRPPKQRKYLSSKFVLLNQQDHQRDSTFNSGGAAQDDHKGHSHSYSYSYSHNGDHDANEDGEEDHNQDHDGSKGRDWNLVRPDILHFCLLAVQDSILNKQGLLQVYISTLNGNHYKVSPEFRIPRTWKVFNKVMANYLHSNSAILTSQDTGQVLIERVDSIDACMHANSINVAISQLGVKTSLFDFIKNSNVDSLALFISISPNLPLDCENLSGVLNVAKLHAKALARLKHTPRDPLYSQNIEDEPSKINRDVKPQRSYQHVISITCSNSVIYTCHKTVAEIESALNL